MLVTIAKRKPSISWNARSSPRVVKRVKAWPNPSLPQSSSGQPGTSPGQDIPPQSDADLLLQLRDGVCDAATELYNRYAQRLLRLAETRCSSQLATRVDAEDIVQSVFRTFFRRASDGLYHLPDGEELWKLFLVISLNKIRKKAEFHCAAKRDIKRTQSMGNYQEPLLADNPTEVLRLTIEELISRLPAQHQQVIRDRIAGFEIEQIAQRSTLSKRTVERILQMFRKRLGAELEAVDG